MSIGFKFSMFPLLLLLLLLLLLFFFYYIKFYLILLFSACLFDSLTLRILVIIFSSTYSSLFYNCTAFLSHIYSFSVIFVYFTTVNSSNFGIAIAGCFYPAPGLVGFSDKFYTA